MTSEEAAAADQAHSEVDLLRLLVEKEARSWGIWSPSPQLLVLSTPLSARASFSCS
jgi:hypothetical protein